MSMILYRSLKMVLNKAPENDGDCFRLGQISKNVPSCTQTYINDVQGNIAKLQKLIIHKNVVINNLCGD